MDQPDPFAADFPQVHKLPGVCAASFGRLDDPADLWPSLRARMMRWG